MTPVPAPARLACVSSWIYFLHPPRQNFADTMSAAEEEAFGAHFAYLQELLAEGVLVLAGPTLGETNTGLAIFEAADEDAARAVMDYDPAIAAGEVTGELREMRVSLLRGR
jgi:uncharacterized protein YciI